MIVSRPTAKCTARRPMGAAAATLAALLGVLTLGGTSPTPARAVGAADDHTVLILSSTVSGGASSVEATKAQTVGCNGTGCTVELVDASGWAAKSAADFRTYRALILGDPTCGGLDHAAAAEANTSTWGPVVNGNVIVIGTDERYHDGSGGNAVSEGAIKFATDEVGKTGALISLSCYYSGEPPHTPVPLLDGISPGGFVVDGTPGELCYNNAHIVAVHPALAGITDTTVSGWSCSVHESFEVWPPDFLVLAIAKDLGSAFTAPDGSVGNPYILARGRDLRARGLSISPAAATNPTGSTHTVVANLRDADDNPVAGATIGFSVLAGSVNAGATGTCNPADCKTDAAGNVAFTYTGAGGVGADTILAFIDGTDTIPANGAPDPGEPQVRATKNWIIFDPFGGVVKATTRTLKLKLKRPEGADGVRCALTDASNPDFGDTPFTMFPEGSDDLELDLTLTGDNGDKTLCCQFSKMDVPILQPVCEGITLGTCDGIPASSPGCFCFDSASGAFTDGTCGADSTCSCGTPEICGNCVDDDRDGAVDYEDTDCCAPPPAGMVVKKSKVLPNKADIRRSKLKLKSILAQAGFDVNPMMQDTTLQIRDSKGELFCVNIGHEHWMRMHGKVGFWDKAGTYAKGLTDGSMVTKKSGRVVFKTHGDRVDVSGFGEPQITVTVGVGSKCSSGAVTLKKKKGSRLVFP